MWIPATTQELSIFTLSFNQAAAAIGANPTCKGCFLFVFHFRFTGFNSIFFLHREIRYRCNSFSARAENIFVMCDTVLTVQAVVDKICVWFAPPHSRFYGTVTLQKKQLANPKSASCFYFIYRVPRILSRLIWTLKRCSFCLAALR